MILNVGIIGTGMAFAKLHLPAYQELSDKYAIRALCDLDIEKAKKWAGILGLTEKDTYKDFREMVQREDIDVFDIMVPIELNFPVTEEVARSIANSGRGIISEKPTADNLRDADAHRMLPQKYNVPIMIAENYRYSEENNIIRDMVREKKVGDIVYFIYHRALDFPQEMRQDAFPAREWRQYPDYHGGAFLDSGVHDLAAMRHIFGAVEKVHALGKKTDDKFTPYAAINVNMLFQSEIPGQYSFYCTGKEVQAPLIGFRIFGTQGMIYLEDNNCGTINVAYNNGSREEVPYQPQRGFYNELLNYYNAFFNKEPLFVTPEMAFGDTKMALDIVESLKTGKVMPVDREMQPA
ncbi:MAG: Gfo/Idh/MocA family oxidoreductase [Firmicutes bacterium]|nr:Gfo/Idh/MocA family oxidoreductase [Bacillota bacterium]